MTRPTPSSDAELAALERRWTITASVVLALALCGAIAVILVPAFAEPAGGVNLARGWPPFNHTYNSLETLVSYWWVVAIPALIIVGAVAVRSLGRSNGLIAVGALLLVVAVVLAVRPIRSYPETKQTPGAGNCNAVLGAGPYGDGDETCFDVRRARRFDVEVAGASGCLILGLGLALRAHARR